VGRAIDEPSRSKERRFGKLNYAAIPTDRQSRGVDISDCVRLPTRRQVCRRIFGIRMDQDTRQAIRY
jgi:hypothetical protein